MADNFIESHHVPHVFTSAQMAACEDMFNGHPASDVLNMSKWRKALFVVSKLAGATGRATITVLSCDNTTPDTQTAIAFKYRAQTTPDTFGGWTDATTSGFTTTAGANQVYEVLVDSAWLSGSEEYVRLKCTESVDDPVDGAIVCILFEPRYGGAEPATVLT
jgi:hypothetical protein